RHCAIQSICQLAPRCQRAIVVLAGSNIAAATCQVELHRLRSIDLASSSSLSDAVRADGSLAIRTHWVGRIARDDGNLLLAIPKTDRLKPRIDFTRRASSLIGVGF